MSDLRREALRGFEGRPFDRFTPKRAVTILASSENTHLLSKPWAAICLVFWAFLDGRPGKTTDKKRKLIWSNDARRAGNILLLNEMRELSNKGTDFRSNSYQSILQQFIRTAGFVNAMMGYPAEDLLAECKENYSDIEIVIDIARFLFLKDAIPKHFRNIEVAKVFASRFPRGSLPARPGVKAIEKIWSSFVGPAPYLLALHADSKFSMNIFDDIESTIDWIKDFAADTQRLDQFLGTAALTADRMTARKTRLSDFRNIQRPAVTSVAEFTNEEVTFITSNIDRKAAIASAKFKPRTKNRR